MVSTKAAIDVRRALAVPLFADEAVLFRTQLGQRVAAADALELSGAQRSLLLLVNGVTPLRSLLDLWGFRTDPLPVLLDLLEMKLVAVRD
jgi:hypothetical protein